VQITPELKCTEEAIKAGHITPKLKCAGEAIEAGQFTGKFVINLNNSCCNCY
jgi:hypothetical protein